MDSRLKRLVSEYASLSCVTCSSVLEVSQKRAGETWRDRDEGRERQRQRQSCRQRQRQRGRDREREREWGVYQ